MLSLKVFIKETKEGGLVVSWDDEEYSPTAMEKEVLDGIVRALKRLSASSEIDLNGMYCPYAVDPSLADFEGGEDLSLVKLVEKESDGQQKSSKG